MLDFYQEIVPKLEKTWIINGDTDAGIIPEGTRKAVRAIGFPETSAFRPWFYNQTGTPLAFIGEKNQSTSGRILWRGTSKRRSLAARS